MATTPTVLLNANSRHRKYTGVDKFHAAGYYGERIIAATGESWSLDEYNPGGLVLDPLDRGTGNPDHPINTASTFFQFAPKAKLVMLNMGSGSFNDPDKCYCRFLEESLPVIQEYGILNQFCSFTSNPNKTVREMYQKAMDQVPDFKLWWSIGNDDDDGYNKITDMECMYGVGAYKIMVDGSIVPEYFSSESVTVDFCAPDMIYTSINATSADASGGPNTGTSFASPTLCAMACLVDDFFIDKTGHPLTRENMYKFFLDNCEDLKEEGFDVATGHGAVRLPDPSEIDIEKYATYTSDTPLAPGENEEEGNMANATEQAILHSENNHIRKFTGVTKFHDAGYYGERVSMATGESWDISNFNPDGLVQIPFGNGSGWGNMGPEHGPTTAGVFFQVAPKSKLYQMQKISSARTGKNCYCGLEKYCMDVIKENNILGIFCSYNMICDKYLSEKYTQLLDELGTFNFVVAADNSDTEEYNPLMQCDAVTGVGAYYVSGSKAILESFSSESEYLDVAGPDRQIIKFAKTEDSVIEHGTGERGTSYSAPWILGMMALVDDFFIDKTGKPLTYKAMQQFVKDHCMDIGDEGFDVETGFGAFILPDPAEIDIEKYQPSESTEPETPNVEPEEPGTEEIKYPAIFKVIISTTNYEKDSYVCATGKNGLFMTVVGPAFKDTDGMWVAVKDGLDAMVHQDCLEYVCRFAGKYISEEDYPEVDIPNMSKYAPFEHKQYAAGVTVDIIPHDSIKKLDFFKCMDPRETLNSVYSRIEEKPQIMINGGLFNMSNGINILSFVDETIEQNYQNNFEGLGIKTGDVTRLVCGVDKDGGWKDFMSAYPVLVRNGVAVETYDKGTELNYNAARQAIGYKSDGSVIIVTVDKIGAMKFDELARIFVESGAEFAMNLDGGGSVQKWIGGEVANSPTENRAVDNVFMVYLNDAPIEVEFPAIYRVEVNSNLRVREEPNTDCGTLGYLENGRSIIVYSIENGWAKISTNIELSEGEEPIEGYCSSDWITYVGPYEETEPEQPEPEEPDVPEEEPEDPETVEGIYKMFFTTQLRVRTGPSNAAPTIGYIQPDTLVHVYEFNGEWARIDGTEFLNEGEEIGVSGAWCLGTYLEYVCPYTKPEEPEEPEEPTPDPEPEKPEEGEDPDTPVNPPEEEPEEPEKVEITESMLPAYCKIISEDGKEVTVYSFLDFATVVGYSDPGEEVICASLVEHNNSQYALVVGHDDDNDVDVGGVVYIENIEYVSQYSEFTGEYIVPDVIGVVKVPLANVYIDDDLEDDHILYKIAIGTPVMLSKKYENDDGVYVYPANMNIVFGPPMYIKASDVNIVADVVEKDTDEESTFYQGIYCVKNDNLSESEILKGDLIYIDKTTEGPLTTIDGYVVIANNLFNVYKMDKAVYADISDLTFVDDWSGEMIDITGDPDDSIEIYSANIDMPVYDHVPNSGDTESHITEMKAGWSVGIGRILTNDDGIRYGQIEIVCMDSGTEENPVTDSFADYAIGGWVMMDNMTYVQDYEEIPDESDKYEDLGQASPDALDAIKRVIDSGLMIGSGSMFRPMDDLTREEAAIILDRLLDMLDK